MKMLRTLAIVFLGSLLLVTTASAVNKMNKKNLHLFEDATVKGTLLHPGDYKVEWSGPGPNVRVDLVQDGTTVATVSARVEAENTPYEQDGYVLHSDKNGGKSLEEIFFSGKKYDLKIKPSGKTS